MNDAGGSFVHLRISAGVVYFETLALAKWFSLAWRCVLSDFAREFTPGASAHRFTKSQCECHWALASGLNLAIFTGNNDFHGMLDPIQVVLVTALDNTSEHLPFFATNS